MHIHRNYSCKLRLTEHGLKSTRIHQHGNTPTKRGWDHQQKANPEGLRERAEKWEEMGNISMCPCVHVRACSNSYEGGRGGVFTCAHTVFQYL